MHHTSTHWRNAALAFALALAIFATGVAIAMSYFPDTYDWAYSVVSRLASRKYNPEGGRWFSAALGLSMLALWPVVSYLRDTTGNRRWPILALRAGILFGVLVGIERITFVRFSSIVNNGHELLAVGTFAGLYTGMLGLYAERIRRDPRAWAGIVMVVAPLVAIMITQVALYFDQRDLGWVDHDWRALGVSVWLSFAFWQWLAIALLWTGLGHLLWSSAPARTAVRISRAYS